MPEVSVETQSHKRSRAGSRGAAVVAIFGFLVEERENDSRTSRDLTRALDVMRHADRERGPERDFGPRR